MSVYQDMRRAAIEQTTLANSGGTAQAIYAMLLVGIIYGLLAIAAAIADLKP